MTILAQGVAAAFAALLLAAFLGKVDSWSAWQDTLSTVSPLPDALTAWLMYGLPLGEGLVAILIVVAPELGLLAAALLFASLAIAVWLLSAEHQGQSCSCFGAMMPSEISPRLAQRNVVLAILAGVGAYVASRVDAGTLPFGVLVITVVAGLFLSLVLQFHRFARTDGVGHG